MSALDNLITDGHIFYAVNKYHTSPQIKAAREDLAQLRARIKNDDAVIESLRKIIGGERARLSAARKVIVKCAEADAVNGIQPPPYITKWLAENDENPTDGAIPQENFFDAVRNDPTMTQELKDYWLAQEPNTPKTICVHGNKPDKCAHCRLPYD
jgi:hypothetical protein